MQSSRQANASRFGASSNSSVAMQLLQRTNLSLQKKNKTALSADKNQPSKCSRVKR